MNQMDVSFFIFDFFIGFAIVYLYLKYFRNKK